jgi:hypothetical protein
VASVFFEENFLFFTEFDDRQEAVMSWNGEGLLLKYCKENLEKKNISLLKFSFIHTIETAIT